MHRRTKQVALREAAAFDPQPCGLLGQLNSFGADRPSERRAEQDDGTDDRGVSEPRRQTRYERAVDLDDVDRQALEIGERCELRAEIIERDANTHVPAFVEDGRSSVRIAQRGRFCYFE